MGSNELEGRAVVPRLVDLVVPLGSLKRGGGVHILVVSEVGYMQCERINRKTAKTYQARVSSGP